MILNHKKEVLHNGYDGRAVVMHVVFCSAIGAHWGVR